MRCSKKRILTVFVACCAFSRAVCCPIRERKWHFFVVAWYCSSESCHSCVCEQGRCRVMTRHDSFLCPHSWIWRPELEGRVTKNLIMQRVKLSFFSSHFRSRREKEKKSYFLSWWNIMRGQCRKMRGIGLSYPIALHFYFWPLISIKGKSMVLASRQCYLCHVNHACY